MKRLLSVIAFTFILAGCSDETTETKTELEQDETTEITRPGVEKIAPVFTRGDDPIPEQATTCMGNVIYKSDISNQGVQLITEWDAVSQLNLPNEDAAIFQSAETAEKMSTCIQNALVEENESKKADKK